MDYKYTLLYQFVNDTKEDLDDFRIWWERKYMEDPVNYPLRIDNDNSGLWMEFFILFLERE